MKLCMGCMKEMEEHLQVCPHCHYDERTVKQESYYLKPGTIVGGKYIVGKVLKYGGYTVKYIGMDAENNRRVTIGEYLPSDFSTRSEGEEGVTIYSGDAMEQFNQGLVTFLNEGNRIQQLGKMQGIARVYDCIAENDTGYVISEYLEGRTLQEILDRGKVFTPKEAATLVCSILKGLTKVHPQDIIHCDISPETIMLTADRQVKLLDFGATRYVTTANSKSLAIILKQGYAPEEQYRSQGERGPWTDVYALGAVMYRVITGIVPTESVERALDDDLEEPSKLGIAITPSMENALMNALNIYQEDRTASAEAFYQELVSPDTQRIKVKKKKRETGKLPVWAKGLVAVAVCALIVGGGVLFYQNSQNRQKKVVSQKEDKFSNGEGTSYAAYKKQWDDSFGYGDKWSLIEREYCYDSTVKEDTIKEFEDYTGGKLADGAALTEADKLSPEESKKHIARMVIASNKFVTFQEAWEKNCYKKKTATYDEKCFSGELCSYRGDNNQAYGKIQQVEYEGQVYQGKDIKKLRNRTEPLDIEKLSVTIYTGAYYSLPANREAKGNPNYYIGKNVNTVKFFFGKGDGKGKKKSLDVGHYRADYISFNKPENTIMEVLSDRIRAGKKYSEKDEGGLLFNVVKSRLSLGHMTVAELRKKCREYGIKLNKKGFGENYLVTKVDKYDYKRGETVTVADAQAPATPTPVPAPVMTEPPEKNNYIPKDNPSKSTKKPKNDNDTGTDYSK